MLIPHTAHPDIKQRVESMSDTLDNQRNALTDLYKNAVRNLEESNSGSR